MEKLANRERAPLHGSVVEKLREMIISSELQPGEKLSEADIGRAFGVSRTPLREALKLLAAEGLVEIRPHRGAVIAEISREELTQTFDVIGTLEDMAGPLVCDRISNKDLAELEAIAEQLDRQCEAHDLSGYFHLNKLLHHKIIALTENKVLERTYSELFNRIQRARFHVNEQYDRWRASCREHHWILEAMRARNGAEVSHRLKEHSARTAQAILEHLPVSPR